VPAVIYQKHANGISISLEIEPFVAAMNGPFGRNTVFKLAGAGEAEGKTVLTKEVQKTPMTRDLVHVDLYEVSKYEKVVVRVPVRLEGEPPGVKEGGVIRQLRRDVDIRCDYDVIPEFVTLDVSMLSLGQARSVTDIEVGDGSEVVFKHEFAVARVLIPRGVEEDVVEDGEEGEEGEVEGADGDAAEGDAKTEGGE
jgi:large subunit ribosomal protein L25